MKTLLAIVSFLGIIAHYGSSPGQAELSLPRPEEIVRILVHGDEAEARRLAEKLGTYVPAMLDGEVQEDPLCTEYGTSYGDPKIDYVVLRRPGLQAVIQLHSSLCRYLFLIVLEKDSARGWQWLSTVPLFSWYGPDQEITFVEVLAPGEHEIVVRNQLVDRGTGILQVNMMVFKLFDNRLDLIFSETEKLSYFMPENPQEQTSEFVFVPDGRSLKSILETQIIQHGETTLVRWKLHLWFPEFKRFISVPSGPIRMQETEHPQD